LKTFSELAQPKVALVSGDCFGGGLELLSSFDHVISSPQAYFGFWQRRIGLSFGWGGGTRWSEKNNRGDILKLALEARSICSEEAKNLGLIHQIVLDERLYEEGKKWLNSAMQWPEESLLGLRQWTPSRETKIFENLWNSSSHKIALQRYR
jgi:enoyl-CoA hydratase/carnithine racemase